MSVKSLTSGQCRAARGLLNWSQSALVDASGVSIATIKRLEAQAGALVGNKPTIDALINALEAAGVEFIGEGVAMDAGGAGVRLKASADKA